MLTRILGAAGRVLIVSGLVILGFVAYQLWGTGLQESREQDRLLEDYAAQLAEAGATGTTDGDRSGTDGASEGGSDAEAVAATITTGGPPPTPAVGEPASIIEIPRLGLARVVVEGTTRAELKKGPGHYIGTPFPGQEGNIGIAGHRTTYGAPFNRIDELQPGDEVILSSTQGRFTYRVIPAPDSDQAWYAVSPSDVYVLDDVGDSRVTLTACHPKYSARQRIVVHAVLAGSGGPGEPAETVEAAPASDTAPPTPTEEDLDEGLGSSPEELPRAIGWGAAAAALAIGAWVLSARVRRGWIAWVVVVPLALVLVWNAYVHMDRYLPAI